MEGRRCSPGVLQVCLCSCWRSVGINGSESMRSRCGTTRRGDSTQCCEDGQRGMTTRCGPGEDRGSRRRSKFGEEGGIEGNDWRGLRDSSRGPVRAAVGRQC
ncbi:hypothetical protein C8Q76DRAFT_109351 [Earliella scabrosa]|nr:hypothetical protein C8Q76DRAFT_109351 [Earliella scabrosa]